MIWTMKYKSQLGGPYKVPKVCYENSAVSNIMHLRIEKAYTKVVWLYYSQAGPAAPDPEKARTGPVQVLGTVDVQVLY